MKAAHSHATVVVDRQSSALAEGSEIIDEVPAFLV
jgi:hypothetical protein